MRQEILEYKLKGYCCSQMIMAIGLSRLGKENQEMVDASAGLCFGAWQGGTCGILTAANSILYLADPVEADGVAVRDLAEWFEDSFGSVTCKDILEDNPLNKVEKCPLLIDATLTWLGEQLEWEE
ncbi:MAG: C-GCAxxG-C-C family protein [Anaerovoracaceae bacterium]